MKVWYKKFKEIKHLKYGTITGYRVHLIEERDDGTWIDFRSMDQRKGPIRKPFPLETLCYPIDGIRIVNIPPQYDREFWEEVDEIKLLRVDHDTIYPRRLGKGGRKALRTIKSQS